MTNRDWLESLPDEEYDKQVGLHYTKCQWCAYWREGKCNAGNLYLYERANGVHLKVRESEGDE